MIHTNVLNCTDGPKLARPPRIRLAMDCFCSVKLSWIRSSTSSTINEWVKNNHDLMSAIKTRLRSRSEGKKIIDYFQKKNANNSEERGSEKTGSNAFNLSYFSFDWDCQWPIKEKISKFRISFETNLLVEKNRAWSSSSSSLTSLISPVTNGLFK